MVCSILALSLWRGLGDTATAMWTPTSDNHLLAFFTAAPMSAESIAEIDNVLVARYKENEAAYTNFPVDKVCPCGGSVCVSF